MSGEGMWRVQGAEMHGILNLLGLAEDGAPERAWVGALHGTESSLRKERQCVLRGIGYLGIFSYGGGLLRFAAGEGLSGYRRCTGDRGDFGL